MLVPGDLTQKYAQRSSAEIPGDPTSAESTQRSSHGKSTQKSSAGKYPEILLVLGKVPRDPIGAGAGTKVPRDPIGVGKVPGDPTSVGKVPRDLTGVGKVPGDPICRDPTSAESTQRSNWCWKVPGDLVLGKYPEIQLVLGKVPRKYPEIQLVLGKVPRDPTGIGKVPGDPNGAGKVLRDPTGVGKSTQRSSTGNVFKSNYLVLQKYTIA